MCVELDLDLVILVEITVSLRVVDFIVTLLMSGNPVNVISVMVLGF